MLNLVFLSRVAAPDEPLHVAYEDWMYPTTMTLFVFALIFAIISIWHLILALFFKRRDSGRLVKAERARIAVLAMTFIAMIILAILSFCFNGLRGNLAPSAFEALQ
jgi:heme/copper-type cytochrome/quinol oxidase subunit 2